MSELREFRYHLATLPLRLRFDQLLDALAADVAADGGERHTDEED